MWVINICRSMYFNGYGAQIISMLRMTEAQRSAYRSLVPAAVELAHMADLASACAEVGFRAHVRVQVKLRGGFHGDMIQIGNLDFRIARPGEGSGNKATTLPAGTARKCAIFSHALAMVAYAWWSICRASPSCSRAHDY